MRAPTSPTAIKFQEQLETLGLNGRVVEFETTTRTAEDAAAAIGCELGQIVKSLIFKTTNSGHAVVVYTSGSNRVEEKRIEQLVGEPLSKADAVFVRSATGFAIGGVPPFGFCLPEQTYLDEDLLQYDGVWAAAGTPNAVFPLRVEELLRLTGARQTRVKPG